MTKLAAAVVLFAGLSLSSCKPKDADVKANVEKVVTAPGVNVTVNDGVATLTGEVATVADRAAAEAAAKGAKGVKEVVNNLTVTPPAAPVVVNPDEALNNSVRDAVKDFAGVTYTVTNGEVVITGAKDAKTKMEVKKRVDALNPKKVTFN